MESVETKKSKGSRRKKNEQNLYTSIILTQKVNVYINNVGSNLKNTLLKVIEEDISAKCIAEGFIKPNSIEIISYSNGELKSDYVLFQVVIECLACNPVEGQNINCIAKNITKAGIRAELDDDANPLVIFIARDHNYSNKQFSMVTEGSEITVRVIGQRFELNDKQISVIADLVDSKKISKPKLNLGEPAQLIESESIE